MIPLIQTLCGIGIVAGAGGLVWHKSLSDNEKQKAERMARQLAVTLYRQSVEHVTPEQARRIETIVRESMSA
jgi:uncharacterized membrane protein YccC